MQQTKKKLIAGGKMSIVEKVKLAPRGRGNIAPTHS
jgi:hypothetical protein